MTSAETISNLRALMANATPEPWSFDAKSETNEGVLTGPDGAELRKIDAKLIVALRNAAPALLDAAERAEQDREMVAQWAIAHSLPTGHGDTLKDILDEAGATLRDNRDRLLADRDRLAAENAALVVLQAGLYESRPPTIRPFDDAMAERTISLQVKEIDRLAARTGARPQRPELTQIEREYWLKRGGRVAEFEALAASCGLKIVPDDGDAERDRLRDALQRIDNLDQASGYDVSEADAFAAIRIAREALAGEAVTQPSEADRLRERVAVLEAGLRPFALPDGYGDLDTDAPDEGLICTFYSLRDQSVGVPIRRGDFRRARALLTPETTNDQG